MESPIKANKKNLTIAMVLFHIFIIGLFLVLFINLSHKKCQSPTKNPAKSVELSELLKPGNVGEVMVKNEETGEEKPLTSPTMPLVIFSTTGTILKIQTDRIIVKGDGFNFADQKTREITVIFTDSTVTFKKNNPQKYEGLAGLVYLKEGMNILIDSNYNIRGKTEFEAKTINIL